MNVLNSVYNNGQMSTSIETKALTTECLITAFR